MGTYVSQVLVFFQSMVSYVQANNTVLTDFTTGSILSTILNAVAVAVDAVNAAVYNVQQQAYLSTATGSNLDLKAADYNVTRKAAVAATGPFNLVKNVAAAANIDIPAGSLITVVPSPGTTTVQYQTLADATLPIGQTSVSVQVQCTTPGSVGNITAGTQLLLASAIPGVDGATITTAISNGVDIESDTALRARALNSFQGLAIGTYAWYKSQALSVAGVASASIVSGYNTPNGVAVYLAGPNNSIPPASVVSAVQTLLTNTVPMTDNPTALTSTQTTITIALNIAVAAGNSTSAAQSAVQTAVAAYINGLGLGAQKSGGWIYPGQIVSTALTQTGVVDASGVTINGSAAALQIASLNIPIAGTVTPTVVSS